MNKKMLYNMMSQRVKIISLILIFFISFYSSVSGQDSRFVPQVSSTGSLFLSNNSPNIDIGLAATYSNNPTPHSIMFTPLANFHIRYLLSESPNLLPEKPLFQVDAIIDPPGNYLGYVKMLWHPTNMNNVNYAIYQFGPTLINYFGGKVGINTSTVPDDLKLQVTGKMQTTDLNVTGSASTQNIVTQTFKLTGGGNNKILVSDEGGIGTWRDASIFNDHDWDVGKVKNTDNLFLTPGAGPGPGPNPGPGQMQFLYLNDRYNSVGIGTNEPCSKLHVVDGNILISRSDSKAPGSRNGSILFGEVVTPKLPLGEWGIEYYSENNSKGKDKFGGLNFWKVYNESNHGFNFGLYLRDDGNVGINTSSPGDKFQVNDGFEKLALGSANGEELFNGTSYTGFNASRGGQDWTISSNGKSNGGSLIFGDIFGNLRFVTIPPINENGAEEQHLRDVEIANLSHLIINSNGDVGISTETQPNYKLAVNGKILCTELKILLQEDWKDHVFDKSYNLMPLSDVEKFITTNYHLPEVPSAKEVKEEGVKIGEMNAILMQKIEELTLYIINQQKQIDELRIQLKTNSSK